MIHTATYSALDLVELAKETGWVIELPQPLEGEPDTYNSLGYLTEAVKVDNGEVRVGYNNVLRDDLTTYHLNVFEHDFFVCSKWLPYES